MAGVKIAEGEKFCAGRIIQRNDDERLFSKYVSFDTDESEGRLAYHNTIQQAWRHCVNNPCLTGKVATDFDGIEPITEIEYTYKGMQYGFSNNYRCWVIYDLDMCSDDAPFFATKTACKAFIDDFTSLQCPNEY